MLFGCLMALLVWSVFQIFLPPGPVQNTIFSLLGSILFSAYIVYDTDNLIQRKFCSHLALVIYVVCIVYLFAATVLRCLALCICNVVHTLRCSKYVSMHTPAAATAVSKIASASVISNSDCVSIHVAGFDLDQYIWASVTLYLDIINLFLKILQLLNGRRD